VRFELEGGGEENSPGIKERGGRGRRNTKQTFCEKPRDGLGEERKGFLKLDIRGEGHSLRKHPKEDIHCGALQKIRKARKKCGGGGREEFGGEDLKREKPRGLRENRRDGRFEREKWGAARDLKTARGRGKR